MSNLSAYSFFFELPLYTKIKIQADNSSDFLKLMNFTQKVDAYNPILKENSTFQISRENNGNTQSSKISFYEGMHMFKLICVRNGYKIFCFAYLETFEEDG